MKQDGILPKRMPPLTPTEIAINLSHYTCWYNLVNSNCDYALILEDDVKLLPTFKKDMKKILKNVSNINFSILHLWNGNWADTNYKLSYVKGRKNNTIYRETIPYNAGAVAYIISKDYAQFLLKRGLPIKMQQDILMGTYLSRRIHLTLKMAYNTTQECYESPLLDLDCGGSGGTGEQTTQTHYIEPLNKTLKCGKCY